MPMFVITDLDNAGEGLFVVSARDKEQALRKHAKYVPGTPDHPIEIVSCERTDWISLAYATGQRGEGIYVRRLS